MSHLLGFPCNRIGQRSQNIRRFDELFENVTFGGQWETIIQHFVEQFINDHIIFLYNRFGAFSEIILKCIDDAMQKFNNKQRLSFLLASGHKRDIPTLNRYQIVVWCLYNWWNILENTKREVNSMVQCCLLCHFTYVRWCSLGVQKVITYGTWNNTSPMLF